MLRADSDWFLKLRGFENVPNENHPETHAGKHHTYKMPFTERWNRATCSDRFLSLCISEIQGGNRRLPPWPNFWGAPLKSFPFLGPPSLAYGAQFSQNPCALVTNQVPPSHFLLAACPKSPAAPSVFGVDLISLPRAVVLNKAFFSYLTLSRIVFLWCNPEYWAECVFTVNMVPSTTDQQKRVARLRGRMTSRLRDEQALDTYKWGSDSLLVMVWVLCLPQIHMLKS